MGKKDESSVAFDYNDVIRITVIGDVDEALDRRLIEEIEQLISQLRARQKQVLLLADLTQTGKISKGARRLSKEFFRSAKYDRIALLGASKENNQALGFLINTIARVLRVKFFKTENRALLWLRLGRITAKTKARWLLTGAVGLAILAATWHQYVAPYLLRLPNNFSYKATVVSHDNFYNEQTASFSGTTTSDTKLSYQSIGSNGRVLQIKNLFDVRTVAGEKIFSVQRTYGIDRFTRRHVPGYGDHVRTGYLFAPPHLAKQAFTYWHVNYDTPVLMKFQNEEDILGLKTYNYIADYHADQTKDLTNLPGVGKTRGVNLDINLQLWIEPQTGYLVKYEDHTTAYYYDLATGKRLNPWNQFSNSYSFDSIIAQVREAKKARQQAIFIETAAPALFGIIAAVLLVGGGALAWRTRAKRAKAAFVVTRASALVVGLTALTVVFGWITHSSALTRLNPSFSAMHALTAVNFLCVAIVLWLLTRVRTSKVIGSIQLLLSLVVISASTAFARNLGLDVGIDAVLHALGLPSALGVSPITAICFVLISGVLWTTLVSQKRVIHLIAQGVLSLVLVLVTITIAGYAFSLEWLYSIGWFRSMALHTAILFILATVGIFAVHLEWGTTKRIRDVSKSLLLSGVVLVVMLALTGLSWQQSTSSTAKQADIQFQANATSLHDDIANELFSYIKVLQGARGLFTASGEVDRTEWKAYVDSLSLPQNYPGMQGMGFAKMILPAQKAAHTAEIRSQGFPSYAIRPEGIRDVYSSIVFIEPFNERNQRAFGYDMLTEPTRRAALERARDTGEAAMTGRVTLVQETNTNTQFGLLMYLPVYQNGTLSATIEQRRAGLIGYVYMPIRIADFMRATIGERTQGLNVGVFDAAIPNKLTLSDRMFVVDTRYGIENKAYKPKFVRVETLPIAGRALTFRYSNLPNYDVGGAQVPTFVLVGGSLLSLLAAALTFVLISSRSRALKLADAMTLDLRHERNLALSVQQKDAAILENIGEGLVVTDEKGRVVLVNGSFTQLLGWRLEEVQGKRFTEVVPMVDSQGNIVPEPKRLLSRVISKGSKEVISIKEGLGYKRKDGSVCSVAVTASPILVKDAVTGSVEIFRDISKEKEVDKVKSEFVSLASHQLRTPLSTINWYSEMLLEGDAGKITAEQKKYVDEIYRGNQRMIDLVNALLNVSRVDLGTFAVEPQPTDLIKLAQDVVLDLEPRIFARKLDFQEQYAKNMPIMNIDPKLIRMVIENLASNAIKYTPEQGKVILSITRQADKVLIKVTDTGYGIPATQQDQIFSKLFRADNIKIKNTEGTGLGLYLVKSIVEYAGGKIWFESVENQGTTFNVELSIKGMKEKHGSKHLD